MWKFFRALGYLITGRFSRAYEALMGNPDVMAATYDRSIKKQEMTFEMLQDGVSKLLRIKIEKETQFKNLTKEVAHLNDVKTGAGNKAKSVVAQLQAQGKTADEIKVNVEVMKCQAAFNEASASIKDKEQRLGELEGEMKNYDTQVAQYKAQLQSMQRSVENLRNEKSEAIADTIAAKNQAEVNNLLNGITVSTEDEDLAQARRARQEAKAKAQVSAELAGNSAKAAEDEYVKYAAASESDTEFSNLLGLSSAKPETVLSESKLPEA